MNSGANYGDDLEKFDENILDLSTFDIFNINLVQLGRVLIWEE